MKTIRFWITHHGSPVKIALVDGQRALVVDAGPTDEGWNCKSSAYHRQGYSVLLDWSNDGSDCDGRHTAGGLSAANIYDLHRRGIEDDLLEGTRLADLYSIRTMPWAKVVDYPVYDQFAQAMGY